MYNTAILREDAPNFSKPRRWSRRLSELLKLLDDFCSNDDLRNLLKIYRPTDREYPISVNRDELKSSVQKLFGTGHLPRPKLEEVLERAEENGRQHILLYTPTTRAVAQKLNDFTAVESGLLGGRTRAEAGLPKFQIHPKGVEVADLRHDERAGTKYSTWTYKLYAGSERWEQAGKPELHRDEKIVRYRLKYRREVILIKWHSFGLLELRIPIGSGRAHLANVRDKLLATLNAALDLDNSQAKKGHEKAPPLPVAALAADFSPKRPKVAELLVHPPGLQALIPLRIPTGDLDQEARSPQHKWISVNSSDFDVDGHKLSIGADDEHENIYQSAALLAALKPVRDCTRLGVVIHLKQQPDFPEKLAVEFCPNFPNEIRIGAHTTPEAVEFVIRRVWEHARDESLPPSPVDAFVGDTPVTSDLLKVDFSTFARHHPYLANAFLRLGQWVAEHPTAGYLEPARLQKAIGPGVSTADLAVAVATLVAEGILAKKYRVRLGPRKKFIPRFFDSVEQILDDEITDESGEVVDLQDADVVTVYGKAER